MLNLSPVGITVVIIAGVLVGACALMAIVYYAATHRSERGGGIVQPFAVVGIVLALALMVTTTWVGVGLLRGGTTTLTPIPSVTAIGSLPSPTDTPVPPTATSISGRSGGDGNEIEMASINFVQQSVSIHAGQAVIFRDPAGSGNIHILCLGKNMTCQENPQGPSELNTNSGITFNAGDPDKSIVFPNAGTFTVTCTVHAGMDVTIRVS